MITSVELLRVVLLVALALLLIGLGLATSFLDRH